MDINAMRAHSREIADAIKERNSNHQDAELISKAVTNVGLAILDGMKLIAQAILTLSEPQEDAQGDEETSTVDDAEVRRVLELQRGKPCAGCDRYKSECECAPCGLCNEKHCCSEDGCPCR